MHLDEMFRKTEAMLYDYPRMKGILLDQQAEKAEIQKHGMFTGTAKTSSVYQKNHEVQSDSEYERQESRINKLNRIIEQAEKEVNLIERALDQIRDDLSFDLIRLKYFDCKEDSEIAKHFNTNKAGVTDMRRGLIERLCCLFFGDLYLNAVMSWAMM